MLSDPDSNFTHGCSVEVLDGGTVIHMLNVGFSKTFKDFFYDVFLPFIKQKLKIFDRVEDRVDIIWDRYDQHILKSYTRSQRGGGNRKRLKVSIVL